MLLVLRVRFIKAFALSLLDLTVFFIYASQRLEATPAITSFLIYLFFVLGFTSYGCYTLQVRHCVPCTAAVASRRVREFWLVVSSGWFSPSCGAVCHLLSALLFCFVSPRCVRASRWRCGTTSCKQSA